MMKITKEMMKEWCETYDEAVDVLLWVANEDYTKDEMLESLEYFFIDNGLMTEEEFKKEIT